jgi:polyferredoxin
LVLVAGIIVIVIIIIIVIITIIIIVIIIIIIIMGRQTCGNLAPGGAGEGATRLRANG